MLKATWKEKQVPIEIASLCELDSLLNKLNLEAKSEQYPFAVNLMTDENVLTFCLGLERTFLGYSDASGNFVSVGESHDLTALPFFLHGHHSEYFMRWTIPKSDALLACNEFFETGSQPQNIEWEQI